MSVSHSYEATLQRACGLLTAHDKPSSLWEFGVYIDTSCAAGGKFAEGDKVKVTIEKVEE